MTLLVFSIVRRWVAIVILLVAVQQTADAVEQLVDQLLLLDGARAGNRLIVVGERGHILLSDDEANSWRQVKTPTQSLLTAIHMHDHHKGWVVGHDAVILRTTDGGETWDRVYYAPEEELPLLDVWFSDSSNGLAVGAYGFMLATTDGGDVWVQRVVSDDDYHFNVLVPADDNRLYIGAESGLTYRSDDRGQSWQLLPTPYNGSWFAAVAPTSDRVIVAGLRGHMFRSEDGGMTWSKIPTHTTAGLTSIQQLPSDRIIVTGLEGVLLEGAENDDKYTLERLSGRLGITGAIAIEGGDLLLLGEFGARRLSQIE